MGNDLMVDDAAMPYPEEADRDAAFVRLGGRFDEALAFAAEMHREQARKGIPVPYLSHLLGVASLVLEYGGDEDQAIAALLHDTLEDCGTEHAPAIGERFGPGLLALVRACPAADRARRDSASSRHGGDGRGAGGPLLHGDPAVVGGAVGGVGAAGWAAVDVGDVETAVGRHVGVDVVGDVELRAATQLRQAADL